MDGTIAVVVAIIGLLEMNANHCDTGCLARSDADARVWIQAGPNFVNSSIVNNYTSQEITIGYDFGHMRGPIQPSASIGLSADGDVFIGSGFKWRLAPYSNDVFYEGSMQTGIHITDQGPDLGGDIQFKAALGVGYEFNNGSAVLVSFDHRSNAGFHPNNNPGMESVTVQYSMTFD